MLNGVIGMDSKVLNIVTYTGYDLRTDGNFYPRRKAAVFYESGIVRYVSIPEARRISCLTHIKVSDVTLDEFERNYDDYCQIEEFDFIGQDPQPVSSSEKRHFIVDQFRRGFGFIKNRARKCYGWLEKLADWLTVHVLRKIDDKIKNIKVKKKNKKSSSDTDPAPQQSADDTSMGQKHQSGFTVSYSSSIVNGEPCECTYDNNIDYGFNVGCSQQTYTFEYYMEWLGGAIEGGDTSVESTLEVPIVYTKRCTKRR